MTGGWLSVVRGGIAALGSCAAVGAARAETILGAPVSGQMGFLPANTVVQADIEWFHNDILLPVTIGISLLVLVLLAYVVYRFNEQANPVAFAEPRITARWKSPGQLCRRLFSS